MKSTRDEFYQEYLERKRGAVQPQETPQKQQMSTDNRIEFCNIIKDFVYRNPEVTNEQIYQALDDLLQSNWMVRR